MAIPPDPEAEKLLERLSDLENHPNEALTPYEEFRLNGSVYYFTPGGFLYRKDPGTDVVGGFFCGYLTNEVWHYRTNAGREKLFLSRRALQPTSEEVKQ
jgi:hypothetical protein